MSADNWGNCPQCKILHASHVERLRATASEAYGKVPVEEWQELNNAAKSAEATDQGETLREDYEIGIDEDGEFAVSYSAKCDRCGFKFRFEHAEHVKTE